MKGNPLKHKENMQIAHKKVNLNLENFFMLGESSLLFLVERKKTYYKWSLQFSLHPPKNPLQCDTIII